MKNIIEAVCSPILIAISLVLVAVLVIVYYVKLVEVGVRMIGTIGGKENE